VPWKCCFLLFAVALHALSSCAGDAEDAPPPEPDFDAGTINGCTGFKDHTDPSDERLINWDFAIATTPDRCMRIKVGQSVTWTGNFNVHPIAVKDGVTPSPIAEIDTASGKVTFPMQGTFGYGCTTHPAMSGAIDVVP
jgi:hypothetical protein